MRERTVVIGVIIVLLVVVSIAAGALWLGVLTGKAIYGGGEIVFKNGKVYSVSSWTGHYAPRKGESSEAQIDSLESEKFGQQSLKVFELRAKQAGFEFDEKATFILDHSLDK